MKPKIKIIVAVGDFLELGYKNGLPWNNKKDIQFFKTVTENNIVIMGSKTWISLPKRPLLNRENYILSSSVNTWGVVKDQQYTNTYWSKDLYDVLRYCHLLHSDKDIYIIGGKTLYELALRLEVVDEVIISHIYGCYKADVFFPALPVTDEYRWDCINKEYFAQMSRSTYEKVYN